MKMNNLVTCEECQYYPVAVEYICTNCGHKQSKENKPIQVKTATEPSKLKFSIDPKKKKRIIKIGILSILALVIVIGGIFGVKHLINEYAKSYDSEKSSQIDKTVPEQAKPERKSEYFESDILYVEGSPLLDVAGTDYDIYSFDEYQRAFNYLYSRKGLAKQFKEFILIDSKKYYFDKSNHCLIDCSPKEESASLPGEEETALFDSSNAAIALSSSGRYTGDGPCYITNVIAVKTEEEAIETVIKLENEVSQQAGYLWIPDYESLSGAEFFTVFLGPFITQEECEIATEEYRRYRSDALGLLVSHENKRVEIRGIGKVKTIEK